MSDETKEPGAPPREIVSAQSPPDTEEPGIASPAELSPAQTAEPAELAPDANAFQEDPYHGEPYESPAPENYGSAHPGQALASYQPPPQVVDVEPAAPSPLAKAPPAAPPPKPPETDEEEEDEEEEGMLRMSFMEHLEELRSRILRSLFGVAVAFVLSLTFTNQLWDIVQEPAISALKHLGYTPKLVQITPMEVFSIVWVKMPLLVSLFLASPWVLYQIWAFISPGLYKKERRYAVPFILCTAGLFVGGGFFAYFVAFRFGIEFLLGIGRNINVAPMVSITEYFDLFVNVVLGVALVFELPVVIFFLTLLRIASPRFLLRNSRYAVLAIVVLAAVVTPTPDVFNLMLFAVPMCMLFFIGVFASYLLVMKREGRKFPWGKVFLVILGLIAAAAGIVYLLITHYHFHLIPKWPFLIR
jgi:sec-independent protein translocase protein TatC